MYKTIAIDEFYQKMKKENLSIIDVRETDEYHSGHIKQAINMPLSTLASKSNQINSNQPHYIICQAGGRSARACDYLSSQGLEVINVMGGMMSWKGDIVKGETK